VWLQLKRCKQQGYIEAVDNKCGRREGNVMFQKEILLGEAYDGSRGLGRFVQSALIFKRSFIQM
jgi:hypothetical protein